MATKIALTDVAIRKMLPPEQGQAETWDSKVPGFGVRVTPAGTKSFVFLYRHQGKPRRLTLGRYPTTTLAAARDLAEDALRKARRGEDPQGAGVATRSTAFTSVVDEFVEAHCARHNRAGTAKETERLLRREFAPLWGGRSFGDIRKADVLGALDAIIKRGTPTTANNAFAALRKLYNWGIERGHVEVSPCMGIGRPAKHNNRDRVLEDGSLGKLWRAAQEVGYPFGTIFQLLVLTAQRRGEVAGMRWKDLNLAEATWSIPAEMTKNHRQHLVPFPRSAVRLLDRLPRFHDELVFPARGNGGGPYVGFSKGKRKLDQIAGLHDWTLHDLRRTAATGMAKLAVPPHVVERVLNHSSGTFKGVAGVYNRFGYLPEMRDALDRWDTHLQTTLALVV